MIAVAVFADAGAYITPVLFLTAGVAVGGILGWKTSAGRYQQAQYPLSVHVWCAIFLVIGFVAGWSVAAPDPEERALLEKWQAQKNNSNSIHKGDQS